MATRELIASVLAAVGCALAVVGNSTAAPVADEVYSRPAQMVEVEPGRRLNLICLGKGSPTVMLESGAGIGAVSWRHVQAEIAKFTKVCAYDRAGYGHSDRIGRPADARNAVDDLHRLLSAAKIDRSVVLAGHSAGGLYVQLFAATYPAQVAGMVLIAATGTNEKRDVDTILTPEERAKEEAGWSEMILYFARCHDNAVKGLAAGTQETPCPSPRYGQAALDAEMLRQYGAPKSREAQLSEMVNFSPPSPQSVEPLTAREVLARPFRLGDKPLVVIRSGIRVPPGERGERLKALSNVEVARLTSASTRARVVEVDAGHIVQDSRPDVVIAAVRDVVDEVRRSRGK